MSMAVQHMTVLEGLVLGFVQGITEFLPVSSSGHLILARELLGVGDVPLLFDVMLHIATLAAVCLQYRMRIASLVRACLRLLLRKESEEDGKQIRIAYSLIVATVLTVVVTLVLRLLNLESDTVASVSVLMLVTALLLLCTRRREGSTDLSAISWRQTLVVGIAQGAGTLAGISRSGITISAGLYSGLDRKSAGEYAFLLAIPAILGALVLALVEQGVDSVPVAVLPLAIGCVAAFCTGMAALRLLLWVVAKARLWYFSVYLVCVATLGLASSFL